MRLLAITLALMVGTLLILRPSAADAQPEVTYLFPSEGDVLAEPPTQIRMCFASPINTLDLHAGGDFAFSVVTPDSVGLGLRIVLQTDGLGADIFPGIPGDTSDGEWLFEWRVTDPDTLEPATGTLSFTVTPDGSPLPEEPPETCRAVIPVPDATSTPVSGVTPTATPAADGEDDDGLSTLAISLIATASLVGAAAAASLIFYLLRRRKR